MAERRCNAANRGAINAKGFELEAERMGAADARASTASASSTSAAGTPMSAKVRRRARSRPTSPSLGRGLCRRSRRALGAEWNNTVVVVLSEFGRTFRENGNRGTDHGHGTVYWVLGGGINGGRIAGEQVKVDRRATLLQDRDYPGAQRLPRRPRRPVPIRSGV